ncbi:MAG: hypothetical protein CMJ19_10390 [Phycisphaeraceae bacterium]|nr:hypothetical protein [Phycisphaeraceae bacterium]
MQRWLAVFVLSVMLVASSDAQLLLYPTGMINSRLPVIPTRDGGSYGKAFPAQSVRLRYDFTGQLGQMTQGKLELDYRADPGRRETTSIVIGDGEKGIALSLLPASEGRFFVLEQTEYKYGDLRYLSGTKLQKTVSKTAPTLDWQRLQLKWDAKSVTLQYAGKTVATLPMLDGVQFTELYVDGWTVDQLQLVGQNTLRLDWENDYVAFVDVTVPLTAKQMQAALLGFDNFVVNRDPDARDFPMLQVNNPTDKSQTVTASFTVKRELTGDPWQWQQSVTIPAGQSKLVTLAFPQALGSDVYHLQMKVKIGDHVLATDTRHFMHAPRRDEKAGPRKFGLHDCNVRAFGFWPEALPIDMAHHYLRWGYVQGPGWVKDWDGQYGLDPKVPAEQWYWNDRIDWAIDQGREMFVCVQSTPFSDWARAHPYKHMRQYPWGNVGGHPKIDRYRNFLKEVAKRYTGKVEYWEVENEPNAGGHIPADKTDDYVEVCKAVYEELKGADPNTQIFGISGTSKFQPWMDKVLGHGGSQYLDGVSWHTYTSPSTPDEIGFPKIIKESVDIVKKHMPNAPIFNSETGVVVAMRYDVDQAIPQQVIQQKVRENDKAFVANSWMGATFDEWHGGASMVTNAVYNFLGGVEKYVFFGWNPNWPTKREWEKHAPFFSLFSVAADGTRTPSLMTLSVATLTTQMQSALLENSEQVNLPGVRGGLFDKTNGGKLAIIWAPSGEESVLFKTDAAQLEIVDMLGQTRMLNVSHGIAVCDVTELPMYVHVKSKQLEIQNGPIENVVVKANGPASGECEITLRNPMPYMFDGSFSVSWQRGQGSVEPAMQRLQLDRNQSRTLKVRYQLDTDETQTVDKPLLTLTVSGNSPMMDDTLLFHSAVAIPTRPVATVKLATSPVRLHQSQDAMLIALKSADAKVLKLNRLEQVKLGRPPALASLHDPAWWGGEDELSADIQLAADSEGIVLYMDVKDVAARLPRTWPSVKGSVVELFFDFRKPGDGLGDPVYGNQTFQVLIKPELTAAVTDAQVWSPQRDRLNATCFSQYDAKADRYWLVYRMPWAGGVPEVIGFDVAINAAPEGKAGRKTQMILFGDATNARNAAAFGQLVFKP